MKRKILLLLFLALSTTKLSYSQECSCADTFEWLKETIEKNDAGFQYAIDQKGEIKYKKHSESFAEKAKSITTKDECAETLSDWLSFFRSGHLWFGVNDENESKSKQKNDEIIKEKFEKRKKPGFPSNESMDLYFELLETNTPIFEKLTNQTTILRIPSFSYSEKKLIDSVINVNREVILSSENLIIDLRNNGGGSDESFQSLLPIIYTNPIRTVGVELLSTPLNNQRMIDFMNDPDFAEKDKQWAKNALEKLNTHLGEFVNVDSTNITIESYDTIHPYPKNVGIIINEGNGSTTEQFLLAAKQSKKVKLFGKTTMGVLDISNMYSIDSPCNEYKLAYSLSRSMRIPDFTIDDKGIQPDYYIDETISKYDWIDFVYKTLSAQE